MWRTGLVLLLIGSMLIGQSVCCCTFKVLAASTGFASESDEPCCCSESRNTERECPRGSNESDHECPCKKGNVVSATLGDRDIIVPAQFSEASRAVDHDLYFARLLPNPVITPAVTYFGPSAFPHLNGTGILRAVNCMRC